jgi:CheY-like chemotaxis protein
MQRRRGAGRCDVKNVMARSPKRLDRTSDHKAGELENDTKVRRTILLVEDEDRIRRVISEVLQSHGFQVCAAADAEEALEIVAKQESCPELVISDIRLPGRTGRELVNRLREMFPACAAVLISGYGESQARMGGLVAEDISYLAKPFSALQVIEIAQRSLNRKAAASRDIRERL